jgi:hypothetical protein
VNFEEDEDRDRDAMRLLVLENNNLFKYLFDRYTATGGALKRKTSYETISDKVIKLGECVRCLKDHGHDSTYVTVKEISVLVKMINGVMLTRHGSEQLEYPGFVQLLAQASIVAHKKGRVRDITVEGSLYFTHAQMV